MKIIKGQSNTVVCTLLEKTTISNPRYLFAFTSDEKHTTVYTLVGSELSTDTTRYNKFTITETTSPDYSAAEIELSEGEYSYNVFELTAVQAAALDFEDIDTSTYTNVEGACVCRVYDTTNNAFTQYSTDTTNTVYQP